MEDAFEAPPSEAVCCKIAILVESGRPGTTFVAIARSRA